MSLKTIKMDEHAAKMRLESVPRRIRNVLRQIKRLGPTEASRRMRAIWEQAAQDKALVERTRVFHKKYRIFGANPS